MAKQSRRVRNRGVYPIFTTFVLIVTVLAAIVFLIYVNNKMLTLKEQKSSELKERSAFRNIRDRLLFCYGNVVDEKSLVSNLGCLHLEQGQGISIDKLPFGDCPYGRVKELNYRGYGKIEQYDLAIYSPDRTQSCPAKLTVYEHAVNVPLILGVTITPQIAVQGFLFQAHVDFYHTKYPSYIDLSVLDLSDKEFSRVSSGPLYASVNSTIFRIDSTPLPPGLYTTTTISTNDNEFFDRDERAGRFRVVDPKDAPTIHWARVSPNNGTIFDLYTTLVNLSDYVNITSVTVSVTRNGAEVARVNATAVTRKNDAELLIHHVLERAVWDPSKMKNENATYNISVTATNILGNTATKPNVAQIRITERKGPKGGVLVVTNTRVYNQLGLPLLTDYLNALRQDGFDGIVVRLDDATDVLLCGDKLKPAAGPTISAADAKTLIPQCILKFNSSNVLILGGYAQIRQSSASTDEGYYTDDYFADLNGDSRVDVPIGRMPDGTDLVGKIDVALKTAINLHLNRGWQSHGTDYEWNLDYPTGVKSPNVQCMECIQDALDADSSTTCGANPNCHFAPPFSGGNMPPSWQADTSSFYICGHGGPTGQQYWTDNDGVTMGSTDTLAARDFQDTVFIYNPCYGGRIHNTPFHDSSMMQALAKGAAASFGGTATQTFSPNNQACSWPCDSQSDTGTGLLANLAYELNKKGGQTIGQAWLKSKLQSTGDKRQREQNELYGDPSIRVK